MLVFGVRYTYRKYAYRKSSKYNTNLLSKIQVVADFAIISPGTSVGMDSLLVKSLEFFCERHTSHSSDIFEAEKNPKSILCSLMLYASYKVGVEFEAMKTGRVSAPSTPGGKLLQLGSGQSETQSGAGGSDSATTTGAKGDSDMIGVIGLTKETQDQQNEAERQQQQLQDGVGSLIESSVGECSPQ